MRSRIIWLRLCACTLAAPVIWVAGPLSHAVWARPGLVYLACLCTYYVWNPAPNYLWSLGAIVALAGGLALENVASFAGRSRGLVLGVFA